jgi:hypothetical protein
MTDDEVLRDRMSGRYDEIGATARLGDVASAADWHVIVDDSGTVLGAISRDDISHHSPEDTALTTLRSAPAVIADAETPVDALLESPAFQTTAPNAVIAVDGDTVVGIWGGADLGVEVANYSSRFGDDWTLPGRIKIPLVTRVCTHESGGRTCTGSLSFEEKPSVLPQCPDPDDLGAHEFGW